jgi:FKBP-type peptidyl-prolyl cis-trans isomerase SlyD
VYGPITIKVGSGHVVAGLDDDFVGKELGTEYTIDVPPERAFGNRQETLIESVSIAKFKEAPSIGGQVQLEGREGIVINKIGRRVIVDFNHPLSGKTVHYTYTIQEKVEQPEDQVKGLIRLYTQREMVVSLLTNVLSIQLPAGVNYDRRWLLWRGRIINDIFSFIPSVQEINLIENFTRPQEPATKETP